MFNNNLKTSNKNNKTNKIYRNNKNRRFQIHQISLIKTIYKIMYKTIYKKVLICLKNKYKYHRTITIIQPNKYNKYKIIKIN